MPHGDAFEEQVEHEFVEDTRDILGELDVVIGQLANGSEEGKRRFRELLRDLGSLRGAGRYSGFPLLAVTVHRLYDYLAGLEVPTSEQVQDVLTFADVLNGILDGEISHDASDLSEFVRSLPVRRPFDVEDVEHLDIEIMVVEPQRAGRDGAARHPRAEFWSHATHATALAHAGRLSEAKAALARAEEKKPGLSESHFYLLSIYRNPADRELYLEGLRRAGLRA